MKKSKAKQSEAMVCEDCECEPCCCEGGCGCGPSCGCGSGCGCGPMHGGGFWHVKFLGLGLLGLGVLWYLRNVGTIPYDLFWPIVLVLGGLAFIAKSYMMRSSW